MVSPHQHCYQLNILAMYMYYPNSASSYPDHAIQRLYAVNTHVNSVSLNQSSFPLLFVELVCRGVVHAKNHWKR